MSRRHWRKVKRALRNQGTAWAVKFTMSDRPLCYRKHRNTITRNGKTAAQWFPLGVDPKRVVRSPQFNR